MQSSGIKRHSIDLVGDKTSVVIILFLMVAGQFGSTRATAAEQLGVASVYFFNTGSRMANGERFNPNALTAAHRTLPFGTNVLVTNKKNGRSVAVTITDRGPFLRGRIIDVSPAAARELGFSGLTQVVVIVANELPAIAAVPIGHRDGPAVLPSEPAIPVAAIPETPAVSVNPLDAADPAPTPAVTESPAPAASAEKTRTRSNPVQRRDRNEYSRSVNYGNHYYQSGYARLW